MNRKIEAGAAFLAGAMAFSGCGGSGVQAPTEEPDYNTKVTITQRVSYGGFNRLSIDCWTNNEVDVNVNNDATYQVRIEDAYCPIPENNGNERRMNVKVRKASGLTGFAESIPVFETTTPFAPEITNKTD